MVILPAAFNWKFIEVLYPVETDPDAPAPEPSQILINNVHEMPIIAWRLVRNAKAGVHYMKPIGLDPTAKLVEAYRHVRSPDGTINDPLGGRGWSNLKEYVYDIWLGLYPDWKPSGIYAEIYFTREMNK